LSVNLPSKRNDLNIQVNINKDGSKPTPNTNIDSVDRQKQRLDNRSTSKNPSLEERVVGDTHVITMKIKTEEQKKKEEPMTNESPAIHMSNM
jgi:hypothetical protein